MVVHAVGLARRGGRVVADTLRTKRHRARWNTPPQHRGLARPRRARDDDNQPSQLVRRSVESASFAVSLIAHSTFWIISRMRSMAVLISITWRGISTSLAFEPMVLASRNISWVRNSSFRPELSGRFHDRLELVQVAPQADDFLGDVAPLGKQADLPDQVGRVERDVSSASVVRAARASRWR